MKIRINSTTYDIPTNYSQVKFKDFAQAKTEGMSLENKLSYQTGIPSDILTNLPYAGITKFISALEFWDSEPEFYEPWESDIEVGNEHYVKLEQSRAALQGNKWLGIIEVVRIYTGKDISESKVTQAMGYAAFFLTRLESLSSDMKGSESTRQTKTS